MTRHRYEEEILFCLLIVSLSLKQQENIAVDEESAQLAMIFVFQQKENTETMGARLYADDDPLSGCSKGQHFVPCGICYNMFFFFSFEMTIT